MKNLRYDRHGINDGSGRRLATFSEEGRPMAEAGLGRLFAYSPDLLEALESALPAMEYYHEHEGAEELLAQVRGLLAVVKGGAK